LRCFADEPTREKTGINFILTVPYCKRNGYANPV